MNSVINLGEKVLISLRQIIRAIDLHSRYLVKKYGLTGPQLLIMKEIARLKSAPVGIIAENVSLSQATVTSILDRLERLNYIARNRSNTDRRKVIIHITESGLAKLNTNPSLLQEYFIKEFIKLKEWEQTLILSSLQRVASMMNAEELKVLPVLTSGSISATASDVIDFLDEQNQSDNDNIKNSNT